MDHSLTNSKASKVCVAAANDGNWTLAKVRAAIIGKQSLSRKRRLKLLTYLDQLVQWGEVDLSMVANVASLSAVCQRMKRNAGSHNFRQIAQMGRGCISCLIESGAIENVGQLGKCRQSLSPEWSRLSTLVGPTYRKYLHRFAMWSSHAGIEPRDVCTKTLSRFSTFLDETSICENKSVITGRTIKAWNSIATRPGAPRLSVIKAPTGRRKNARIPLLAFPPSLLAQIAEYERYARCEDPFDPTARHRPLSANTICSHRRLIHYALDSLAKTGTDPKSIPHLNVLFEREMFRRICRSMDKRSDEKPRHTNYFAIIVLLQVAKWLGVDKEQIIALRAIGRKLPQPLFRMTNRNFELVRELLDPPLMGKLLDAPQLILGDAMRIGASRLMLAQSQAAVGCAILLHMPLRLKNLADLQYGNSLHSKGAGEFDLRIAASETKEGMCIEYDVPPEVSRVLNCYRDEIVPSVVKSGTDFVFCNVDGTKKSKDHVAYLLKRYVKIFVGTKIHPHIFRHLWAYIILDEMPGAYTLVQQFLNHRSLSVTRRYYADTQTARAGRLHAQLLQSEVPIKRIGRQTSKSHG